MVANILRLGFFFLWILTDTPVFGQNIPGLLQKSDWYKRRGDQLKSFQLLNRALQESQIKADHNLTAKVLYQQANWYNYFMHHDSAIIQAQLALDHVKNHQLHELMPAYLLQNGWFVLRKYDSEKALEYCRAARSLAVELKQNNLIIACKACIEDALNIFYVGAVGKPNNVPVNRAYKRAVEVFKATKDSSRYVRYLARYIDLYRLQGNLDTVQLLLEELKMAHDQYVDYKAMCAYFSLQSIYFNLVGNSQLEYEHLIKALELSQKINIPELSQHFYIRMHWYYKDQKEFDKSIEMLDSASNIYSMDHVHAEGLDLYYLVHKNAGNTAKALEYLERWHNSEDWKRKNEKMDFITEWEIKYKTQEKETQLLKQSYQRNWLIAIAGLTFLFCLVFIFAYRQQRITSEKLSAQKNTITQQADELKQLDKVKSRFFANVSHELRTPLTLIIGPLQTVLNAGQLPPAQSKLLNIARSNGQTLLTLTNEILDLTKLEAGKLELKEESVVLYILMQRIVSSFESLAEYQQVQLQFQFNANQNLHINLDVDKFQKVINNLLSNALKFTQTGGRVELSIDDLGSHILFRVMDTGRGIHADDLPYIFNRFYQSKTPNGAAEGGTGIGLALSQEYAKLFKGRLEVESIYGKGSTFIFEFPKKEEFQHSPKEVAIATNKKQVIQTTPHQSKTPVSIIDKHSKENDQNKAIILLVEDNHSLREYIQLVLAEKYQVVTAQNGQEALKLLKTFTPHLIISDVMMPVMDGFQLLENLKSSDLWRHIPAIMLTARAELSNKLKALRIGVDDYLTKPFEEEELLARVTNLLENARQRISWLKDQPELTNKSSNADQSQSQLSRQDIDWLEGLEQIVQENQKYSYFNVERLSEMLFLSRRQLQRRIKQFTGLSPKQYVQESRLQFAREQLENRSKSTVKAISFEIGIRDVKYFSQQFKKRFGKLPSSYF